MPYSKVGDELVLDLFTSSHPLWRTLLEKPPEGIRYVERRGNRGNLYLVLSGLARVKKLIHFCNGVKLAFGRRWVADMESVKVFFPTYESMYDSDAVASAQRRLETGECKYIMPLTKAAQKTIERFIKPKSPVKVVYPTFYSAFNIDINTKRDTVLFVGGSWTDKSFQAKGGVEVAEAWLRLYRSFPTYRMVMLSSPPPNLVKRLNDAGVEVGAVPRRRLLQEIFPRSRVILLPSMMDSVGYSVLEAMNFGVVPVVSDHFAMPEIVDDAGVIVRAPAKLWYEDGSPNLRFKEVLQTGPFEELTGKLADVLTVLLSDDDYWGAMSEKAFKRICSPPFSIDYRNNVLKQVYTEALHV